MERTTSRKIKWGVGLTLGLPLMIVALPLMPIAFLWYLNASGLYSVMRTTRQREKRRAGALREAAATSLS